MKSTRVHLLALAAGLLSLVMVQAVNSEAQPATANASALQKQVFSPGFDDLMTLLVQPRHLKLFYAGNQKNWELAAFQLKELRSAFGRIVQTTPRYHDLDVDEAIKSMMAANMKSVESAIAAADSKQFNKAYSDLTAGCNSCHVYMAHPFLVMKEPQPAAHSAYLDQEFAPRSSK